MVEPFRDETEPDLLFAYGTLRRSHPKNEWIDWVPDAVRGRLFGLGPYPVLVDWEDSEAGWVEGDVRSVERRELEGALDSYEGVGEGLFRRVVLTTRAGRRVWVYVYPHPVPPGARGPLDRWE